MSRGLLGKFDRQEVEETTGIKRKKADIVELLRSVEAAKNGDSDAFLMVLKDRHGSLCAIAKRYFIKGADSLDIYQEACIALYDVVCSYNIEKGPFRSFADACVEKRIITCVSRQNAQKRLALNEAYSLDEGVYFRVEGGSLDFPLNIVSEDHEKSLPKTIRKYFSKMETKVFCMRHLEGMSYKEIREETGLDEKKVDNCLCRIAQKIKGGNNIKFIEDVDVRKPNFFFLPTHKVYYKYPDNDYDSYDPDSFGYWSLGMKVLEEI